MADQDNGQPITSDNFVGHINGSGNEVADALQRLANAIEKNPDVFGRGARATRESQSNFASNSGKWKFSRRTNAYKSTGNFLDDFENGMKEQLLDTLAGGSFKKGMQGAMSEFTKQFGISINQIPNHLGKQMMKSVMSTETGKAIRDQVGKSATRILGNIFDGRGAGGKAAKDALMKVGQSFLKSAGGEVSNLASSASEATTAVQGVTTAAEATTAATEATTAATTAAAEATTTAATTSSLALGELSAVALEAIPVVGAVVAAFLLLEPAIMGEINLLVTLGKSFVKNEENRKKRADEAQKRLQADVEYMVKEPFEILKKATEEWTSTWDSNLRTIGQTQGYDKEAVYALYEGYADRLRSEGLGSVIGATDIVSNLSNVLGTGLSGEVAEEFAYIATKLGAAIPGQDFFGYADVYASIAANEIAQGKSQTEALKVANTQLEEFASNLLYSSRELAGGFTTGLKDSTGLFRDAVQIAQTARSGNVSAISGTLTSVSAIIGSIAPDLASGLVENVVQAATGGNNNSSLVALRSLAGINAGNTEFLKAMAEDPQSVFSALFTNLANMQNMSPDNYMEVAEGLAEVFGIDKAAFARVDFNYLAQAIDAMDINNQSLQENVALLASGQTTTSAEQLKMQEVNSIILEEGLAYVIDSEAGRMIQQHMWDEQIANEMQEATYGVELQGAALQYLEGIREVITNILNLINPVGFIANGITQMTATMAEVWGNQDDIAEILVRGAVGSNTKSFYNLTTAGKDLNLVTSLVEMMGGKKGNIAGDILTGASTLALGLPGLYTQMLTGDAANSAAEWLYESVLTGGGSLSTPFGNISSSPFGNGILGGILGNSTNSKTSRYSWGTVGKSVAGAIQASTMNTTSLLGSIANNFSETASQVAQQASNQKFQEFLNSAEEASKTMGYESWVQTARNFGISNFADALDAYGRTEDEIKAYFTQNQTMEAAKQEIARQEDEQLFRDETRAYWDYASGTSGVFQTAMWLPFFGDGMKYDSRMDAVDTALVDIQTRIGTPDKFTVIGGIEDLSRRIGDDTTYTVIGILTQIHGDITTTFISTSSLFQRCLADWTRYIAESKEYTSTVSKSTAWNDFKAAEADQQTQATLALANALGVFSAEELKKMDPQLQTNALLGEIVIILQSIMQQNNNQVSGMGLIDTISALGLGVTTRQQ